MKHIISMLTLFMLQSAFSVENFKININLNNYYLFRLPLNSQSDSADLLYGSPIAMDWCRTTDIKFFGLKNIDTLADSKIAEFYHCDCKPNCKDSILPILNKTFKFTSANMESCYMKVDELKVYSISYHTWCADVPILKMKNREKVSSFENQKFKVRTNFQSRQKSADKKKFFKYNGSLVP